MVLVPVASSYVYNKAFYRNSLQLTVYHEGVAYSVPGADLSLEERYAYNQEEKAPSLYADRLDTHLFKALKHFWKALDEGKVADVALLDVVGDSLIAEIVPCVDEIMYLTQLRVRDPFTYSHTLDVAAMSIALATQQGLPHEQLREVAMAALLHDLGKLLIPKAIMFKVGRLSKKEFDVMKLHPELGYRILKCELKLPEAVCLPALQHQEMNGGGGYPNNLKGNEIHLYSQIVKIADVYDALTSKRPYKEPIPSNRALGIMLGEGAKSFNPELLAAFCKLANFSAPELPAEHNNAKPNEPASVASSC
jgi:HD-GYP domain-containing protein (c-di-GMP phosphodiesterase class II)